MSIRYAIVYTDIDSNLRIGPEPVFGVLTATYADLDDAKRVMMSHAEEIIDDLVTDNAQEHGEIGSFELVHTVASAKTDVTIIHAKGGMFGLDKAVYSFYIQALEV